MDWFALFPSYFARESKLASDKKSLFAHAQSEKLIWLSCHYCKNWKSNWKSKKKNRLLTLVGMVHDVSICLYGFT